MILFSHLSKQQGLISLLEIATFLILLGSPITIQAESRLTTEGVVSEKLTKDSFGSLSLGHNLSSNGRTLDKNQWSIGSLYLAHGLFENVSIATSPFVFYAFDMFNLMVRVGAPLGSRLRLSWDLGYFKTFGGEEVREPGGFCTSDLFGDPSCRDWLGLYTGFLMEAVNAKATLTWLVSKNYRVSSTLSYFYYIDDRLPFSFRMDPANGDRHAINLTSFHEFRMSSKAFLNLEIGFWGMNYQYPYLHSGASVNFQKDHWLFGFGASTTWSPTFPVNQVRQFVGYDSRLSVHPEVEIQYFF